MASLKTIRKRISSVKSTQQITRAMKLVSAAKLRRAQEAVTRSRPFSDHLAGILSELLERSEYPREGRAPHPLLQVRPDVRRVELVVLTSDRGLCGSFNTAVLRQANRFLYEREGDFEEIVVSTIGRKARDWARRRRDIAEGDHHAGIFGDLQYWRAEEIATDLSRRFLERELDAVYLLYNRFRSAISQELTLTRLLPVEWPEPPSPAEVKSRETKVDFKYEPSREAVLEKLLPQYLATQVWQALLESVASEHGARMTAMESATRNAGDMIDRLSLMANRTRQAVITKELMEIVSGAEALK